VRDAEGRPKGGSRLAKRGETERQRTPEQPDPERSEGARPKNKTPNFTNESPLHKLPPLPP